MDGDSRFLYVPMENRVREFDSRALLSVLGASANFQVILGPKAFYSANIQALPRGLRAFKTLNKLDANGMRIAAEHGHTAIAWDEEGPGQIVPEIYLKGIDVDAIRLSGRIFAWGDHQAQVLRRTYPEAANKIQAVGNPRWDILRPAHRSYFAPETEAIRVRYGRIILVNTNFSTYNAWSETGFEHVSRLADQAGVFRLSDQSDQQTLREIFEFEKGNFQAYAAMLPVLGSAFPQHTIVVRPHPTENHERWRVLTAPYTNVKTVYEGTVIPWILAADAVVQNSCTTGVESLTLGKPVVSYCKFVSPLQDWHLANAVCPRVDDEHMLVQCLRQFISNPSEFVEPHATGWGMLGKHISRLGGETASAGIIEALGSFAHECEKNGAIFDREYVLKRKLAPIPTSPYLRLKLAPISFEEFMESLGRIARIHPSLPAINISQIAESTFYLRRQTT